MNKQQAAATIARLMVTYPNYNPKDHALAADVWLETVGDLPPELVKAALSQYTSEAHDFAPAPGTIRQYAIHLQARADGVPTAAAAMQEVTDMPPKMERSTETNERDENGAIIIERTSLKFSHPFVEKIARMIGWPKTWPSDNPAADRAQFLKMYEGELKNALQDDFALPAVRAYLSGPQSITKLLKG